MHRPFQQTEKKTETQIPLKEVKIDKFKWLKMVSF